MIFLNSNLAHNPVFVEGKGAYLIDRKGELAFDTWLGSGTLIFGHDKTTEKSEKLLPSGPDLDQLFFDNLSDCVDFSIGAIGFQTSGSSAVTRAVRLARAATRKDVVVVIGSFWHGSENEFLFKNEKRDISVGVTSSSHSDVVWFHNPYFAQNHTLEIDDLALAYAHRVESSPPRSPSQSKASAHLP